MPYCQSKQAKKTSKNTYFSSIKFIDYYHKICYNRLEQKEKTMSDKDKKLEKILENKLNYQNSTSTTEDEFDEIDEAVNEIAELIEKAPDEDKPKIIKELSDGLRQTVLEDVIMSQLYAHMKDRHS